MRRLPLLILALVAAPALVAQRDCSRSSFGLTPLTELTGTYVGMDGGLYGGGSNQPPTAHASAGLAAAAAVQPLAPNGQPAPNGSIVLLSIGMSNATQEFSTWKGFSDLDPARNPAVVVVDGAQGGVDAARFANPNDPAWSVVAQRLTAAGVTAAQVQAIYLKEAMASPSTVQFPGHAAELTAHLVSIAQLLHQRYPNVQQCFVTSRAYGGYSTRPERSEPLSFETGFAVRQLIARQIQGDPALTFDPASGTVRAPWIAWGPYLWADGVTPRADGLTWRCDDFAPDGIHPAAAGRLKVADLIDAHFTTSPFTGWYRGGTGPAQAGVLTYGEPCEGSNSLAGVRANGVPAVGNASYAFGATRLPGSAPVAMLMSSGRAQLPLVDRCSVWIDLAGLFLSLPRQTTPGGNATQPLAIPAVQDVIGLRLFTQWLALDAGGTPVLGIGGVAMTPGQMHQVGL